MKADRKRELQATGGHRLKVLVFLTIFSFSLVTTVATAGAATYYVAPNGNDGFAGTSSAPWATFSHAMRVLAAGDTLYIMDGTYNQRLNITVSGKNGNMISFKALNDGRAIIDTQGNATPCSIYATSGNHYHDIDVEGLVCKNSNGSAFPIYYADRITVKRCSAVNANPTGNYHLFDLMASSYVTLEDNAAYGTGRYLYNIYESDYTVLRRNWGLQTQGQTGTPGATGGGIQLYGSNYCIDENNVVEKDLNYSQLFGGNTVWCATYNTAANSNTVVGNIVINSTQHAFGSNSAQHLISGNSFDNNVALGPGATSKATNKCFAVEDGGTPQPAINHLTCVAGTYLYYAWYQHESGTKDSGWVNNATLKNSSFVGNGRDIVLYLSNDPLKGTLTHTYNNFYNYGSRYSGTSAGTVETTVNPSYNTATYGKGAYLMVPPALQGHGAGGADIGAEVLYRYQDGVLTDVPLWPWPMEDRIYRETGISVTWESKGGLWKTLNGVYTPQSSPVSTTTTTVISDTQAPSVPINLKAAAASSSQINLTWTASTDNVGVAGYKIYKNGSLIATTSTKTSYSDAGLAASTTYSYKVAAFDAAGNVSGQSAAVSATTNAGSAMTTPDSTTYLSDLAWVSATNGWGPVERGMSNGERAAGDGRTITLNGVTYAKGLGVHAVSDVKYNLSGRCSVFMSDIGVDDEAGNNGSVVFQVFADGVKLYVSGVMTGSSQTKTVNVDISGKNTLELVVNDAGDGIGRDHADWANARISCISTTLASTTTMATANTTPPSTPTGLTATAASSSQINLSWTASTDNVGVAGYRIYRNGALIATTRSTSYSNTGLTASTLYTYAVSAYNWAGNVSPMSASASAVTMTKDTRWQLGWRLKLSY